MPRIVHVDDALVVVDKPAGLPSVPGRAPGLADCAASRVQARYADAQVVHRLDMATSGLLVFARGAAMQRALSIDFAQRQVDKRYVAWVQGLSAATEGEIDLPLAADWPNRPRQRVDAVHGKPSLTRWRRLALDPARNMTLMALQPVTGRSHQLRVHLAALGHPIAGDTLYGGPPAPRLMLHAEHLALAHPVTGAPLSFASPTPF